MYLSEKPLPIHFYKEGGDRDMVIEVSSNGDLQPHHQHHNHHHHHQQQQQMILGDSSGEDLEVKAPKKRAETWVQEETRSLISFRRDVDGFFNTSKSNKHLWEQISAKMRDKGFDRSATMCTDKWRNLLKEFKKAKHQDKTSASAKMLYYKELEDLLRDRGKNGLYKSPSSSKIDSFIQFSDKGLEDGNIPFGSVEASGRSTVNLERSLDHDGDPLAITTADAVAASGVPPWNWRETPGNGGEGNSAYGGRVIAVKWGEYTRRIGIDGTADAIKEAIKSAFRLRTKRAFWLEDEDNVIRSLDRDMPLGNYTLHLDEGILIKVCLYDESDSMAVRAEDKTLYTEDEFRDFLSRNGFIGLREINGYRTFDNLDDLRPDAMYQGLQEGLSPLSQRRNKLLVLLLQHLNVLKFKEEEMEALQKEAEDAEGQEELHAFVETIAQGEVKERKRNMLYNITVEVEILGVPRTSLNAILDTGATTCVVAEYQGLFQRIEDRHTNLKGSA